MFNGWLHAKVRRTSIRRIEHKSSIAGSVTSSTQKQIKKQSNDWSKTSQGRNSQRNIAYARPQSRVSIFCGKKIFLTMDFYNAYRQVMFHHESGDTYGITSPQNVITSKSVLHTSKILPLTSRLMFEIAFSWFRKHLSRGGTISSQTPRMRRNSWTIMKHYFSYAKILI